MKCKKEKVMGSTAYIAECDLAKGHQGPHISWDGQGKCTVVWPTYKGDMQLLQSALEPAGGEANEVSHAGLAGREPVGRRPP